MRPLRDILKKPIKVFCLSKNDINSNYSTESPVAPIVLEMLLIDAQFNDLFFYKEGTFSVGCVLYEIFSKNGQKYFVSPKMTLLQNALLTRLYPDLVQNATNRR